MVEGVELSGYECFSPVHKVKIPIHSIATRIITY